MKINIIFPVLDEELRLESGIVRVMDYLRKNGMNQTVVTIVDNGSTDGTAAVSRKLCRRYSNLSYIRIEQKGVGIAFKTAVMRNECEIIGYMDIDLSTDIRMLKRMEAAFDRDETLDMVNASRYHRKSRLIGRKWYRNFVSYCLVFILKLVFHMRATDAICGFKFFRKECIEELLAQASDENGWFLLIEVLLRAERAGKHIAELPVTWVYEEHTKVKIWKVTKNYIRQIRRLAKTFRQEG